MIEITISFLFPQSLISDDVMTMQVANTFGGYCYEELDHVPASTCPSQYVFSLFVCCASGDRALLV